MVVSSRESNKVAKCVQGMEMGGPRMEGLVDIRSEAKGTKPPSYFGPTMKTKAVPCKIKHLNKRFIIWGRVAG